MGGWSEKDGNYLLMQVRTHGPTLCPALSASFRVDGASGGVDGAVFVCRNVADPSRGAARGEGMHGGGVRLSLGRVRGASPAKIKKNMPHLVAI